MDLLLALGLMLAALLLGAAVATWWQAQRKAAALALAQAQAAGELAAAHERARAMQAELARLQALMQQQQNQAEGWRDALDLARDERAQWAERAQRVPVLEAQVLAAQQRERQQQETLQRLHGAHTEVQTLLEAERRQGAEKLALLQQAREALSDQFTRLAAEALETNARRFAEQNQSSLGQMLDPLRQRLADFQRKVEDVYVAEGKDRSALQQQVQQLMQLNQSLGDDARKLTAALRGSVKAQGNWGELVLERVLEASGLRKGEEYRVQDSQTSADGRRQQPDVVICLPEGRQLVVDAKVSLLAYERYTQAGDERERAAALRAHLDSMRAHLRGLSDKDYQKLYGQSLDFVLMFVPVEPAFMTAVAHDAQLFMDAWERNVLLVSPSTLLFVVRTVAHLWRQEAQNRNAQEIARRGAELYDRLSAFVDDLRNVGERLQGAQTAYAQAEKRLAEGRGNVIRQAEMLRELGVKPSKQLPAPLVQRALGDGDGGSNGNGNGNGNGNDLLPKL